uniref:TIGR03756 family integrating conjugative element protein n=2 Tax=Aliivibrio fischeri TaxID=668 RepID=H2ES49_ALIFS|nr:hypothetical protein [Aliivibrio fischeri]
MTLCSAFAPMLALTLTVMATPVKASSEFNTLEVLSSSVCPDCLDYQVIGACVWMTCTPVGCDTDTSIKVKHRLPDAVVVSYPDTGESPWQELKWLSPTTSLSDGGGQSRPSTVQGMNNPNTKFNNVDVIGHPDIDTIYGMLGSLGYFVDSPTTSMMPYYLSSLDSLGWRHNLPDLLTLDTWNPMSDSLGNFGPVFPRGGFVLQPHPFKAAALAAFRAMHLVTRRGESRLYKPLVANQRMGFWPPKGVEVDNDETAFQMIYPHKQDDAYLWPEFDDSTTITDPYAALRSDNDNYAWAVWRMYKGCERKGAMLVAHFGE